VVRNGRSIPAWVAARIGLAAALAVAVMAGAARPASAQPLVDPKIQKADQLFAEGKALLDSNLVEACAKFDESLRYNAAAIGTVLNVALCDEKLGKIASAVARFTEVRESAKEQGLPQHLSAAEEHLAALAPLVPHLTIKLTETLPGTSILLDDQVVAPGGLANIAVDPGERVVVVSAPARLPYRTKVLIAKSEHKDVVVPALAKSVVITSSRYRIGQITTLVGAVAAGTGLGLGLYARHLYHDQFHNDHGDTPSSCTDDGQDKRCTTDGLTQTHRARTLGNVGTIVGVAGVAAAGVGVYLWLRAPHSTSAPDEKQVTLVPAVGPDGVGLAAVGRF
jgi:hypothetical protein